MRLFILLLLQVLILLPFTSFAADGEINPTSQNHEKTGLTEARRAGIIDTYGTLPLYFIENRGQTDKSVSFFERGAGHVTFFTGDGVVLVLTKSHGATDKVLHRDSLKGLKDKTFTTEAVRLSFVGANDSAQITAGEKKTSHVNYFTGNDKTKWRSNIPTYGAVTYKDLYNNIDIKFYGNNRNIEHDVIVRPGGDPSLVRFAYEGVKGLKVNKAGDLEVSLEEGRLIEKRPVIYQEVKGKRVAVDGSYRILKASDKSFTYGFKVASYDKTKDLVIDPVLVYSTYLGGSNLDFGWDIAVDSSGASYVTGDALSTDFPLNTPVQGTFGGGADDAFVSKINPAGTAIVYSTYLGGGLSDIGTAITVDSTGAAYVTGQTASLNFPLVGAIQGTNGGGVSDAFATKINAAGSALVYSTYLGGLDDDWGTGIALDNTGAAYVTGSTFSTNFPVVSPIQGTIGGSWDAFVTKINATGSAFSYSTYLGGAASDLGHDITVDSTGAAYVTGETSSLNFPVVSPIQGANGGGIDAFITGLNPAGTAYAYSTYLGGSGNDIGFGIARDGAGSVYVTGDTASTNFPLVSPIQGTFGGGLRDAFVSKINATGSAVIYSTYLGGSASDFGRSIAVDSIGSANVTGETASTDFPIVTPIQGAFGGGLDDAFATKINPGGSAYVYSTYLGGLGDDMGLGITVDSAGEAYLTGGTSSTDFPVMNPIQGTLAGGGGFADAFITRISDTALPVVALLISPDNTSVVAGTSLGYNVTATNTTGTMQCFNYWENASLPGGGLFPLVGSLITPIPRLCLKAGASQTLHLTHSVPASAPIGAYTFNSFLGAFPFITVSEAHVNFDVVGIVAPLKRPHRSWRLIENGFRKK